LAGSSSIDVVIRVNLQVCDLIYPSEGFYDFIEKSCSLPGPESIEANEKHSGKLAHRESLRGSFDTAKLKSGCSNRSGAVNIDAPELLREKWH
jgi:hypothetical protein